MSRAITGRMEYFVYKNAYFSYKRYSFVDFLFHPTGWLCFIIHFVHSLFALPYTDGEEKIREAGEPLLFRYNTHTMADKCRLQLFCKVRFRDADFLKNDFPPTLVFLRFFRQ